MDYYSELFPNLIDRLTHLQFDLSDKTKFTEHLKSTSTKLVIDVSWADTIEMIECCNKLGVYYINSALENTAVDVDESLYGFPLTERYNRFEDKKDIFTNTDNYSNPPLACGLYAGTASLILDNIPSGVYYVDELLINTQSNNGTYLTYYMQDFIYGENNSTDGLLHQRMKRIE